MICESCVEKKHEKCTNPATCPCQHREAEILEDGTVAPVGVRRDVR